MLGLFDTPLDRRRSDSVKWRQYDSDVLPMWVADMDVISPPSVLRALRARIEHGVFGYASDSERLVELIVERLSQRYGWNVSPNAIVFVPGIVPALHVACHAFASPGEGVLVQSPVYPPILRAPVTSGRALHEMHLALDASGRYSIDLQDLERTLRPSTRLFMLCNPQNPAGRVFSREELFHLGEACVRHDLVLCSDEIHCDLLYPGHQHIPVASLDPRFSERTITLMAPSKTYNLAGLGCAFAVIENASLRARFLRARAGLVSHVNLLGFVAAEAAYSEGQGWLDEVLAHLASNRDALTHLVNTRLPGVRMAPAEGTYLAWLDCRATPFGAHPYASFLREARVALSDGATFGATGQGFVRLNFGCSRALLEEAIERMRSALERRAG